MIILTVLLIIIAVYLFSGFLFSIPFVVSGVKKIDEGAHGTKWGFRIIIIPGTILFWPFLLKKWISATKKKTND